MENISKGVMLGFCTVLFSAAVLCTALMYKSLRELTKHVENNVPVGRILEDE